MRIAVIGLGLIGGSIALAARERLDAEVSGWDAEQTAIEAALTRGVISSGAGSLAGAVAGADAVFVAAPVSALAELARAALEHAGPGCVVTDVGSTKRSIVEAVSDARFVGGHPLAGAETSGLENARANLFDGAVWYLTPAEGVARVPPAGAAAGLAELERLEQLITELGARPVQIDAAGHDRLMATVSHLPHVLANVLVAQLAAADVTAVPGPSFRDATRVAGSNPAVWSDIYIDNRDALEQAIDDAIARLAEVRTALGAADRDALIAWSEQAAADRRRLMR